MIQEEDKYLQHKMETASLKELYPEFDKEAEWGQLSARMKTRSVPDYRWMRAAAVLLIAVSLGGYWLWSGGRAEQVHAHNDVVVAAPAPAASIANTDTHAVVVNETASVEKPAVIKKVPAKNNRPSANIYSAALAAGTLGKTTEAICNATKCAIEICISQTVKCKDKAPTPVADCRTLEPDQAVPLKYTEPEKYGCTVTVDEIRIKKVSTGETIVINSTTQPASAEEMLECFTGEKKCGMMAGFFNTDCDDLNMPRKITIDSHYGDVIIQ